MFWHLTTLITVVLLLYLKTYRYNILIDDEVGRGGYLLTLTTDPGIRPKPDFYDQRRSLLATFTNVGTFLLCVWAVYVQWGFYPALLFAVCPLNVSGVAWTTGNYYMATCWLVLVVHYFAIHSSIWGIVVALPFYVAALGTTLSAIPYAFISITFSLFNAVLIIPLFFFIFGHRFRTGLKKRKALHDNLGAVSGQVDFKRVFVVVKVIAYYIALSLFPSRLGFFHDCSRFLGKTKSDKVFWLSLVLVSLWAYLTFTIDWRMSLWWFFMIGLYSQYTTYGMFTAERYTYLANVALCVLASAFLPEKFLIVIASLWFFQSWNYIKAYKNNEMLFIHSAEAHPLCSENFNNLASYYLDKKDSLRAIQPLLLAERLDVAKTFNIPVNLANCFLSVGNYSRALEYSEKAMALCPQDQEAELTKQINWLREKIGIMQYHQKKLRKMGII